jgi:hypothetical protein
VGEVWEKVIVRQEVCAQDRLGDVGYQETPTEVSPQSQVQFYRARSVCRYRRSIGCGKHKVRLPKPNRDEFAWKHADISAGINEESNTGGFISHEQTARCCGAGVASRH